VADLSSLPSLTQTIHLYGLVAQKKLGQNFLLDQNIPDKIVALSPSLKGLQALEIGPGPGGLTRSLVRSEAEKIIAYEYDPRAVEALQDLKKCAHPRLEIFQQDALNTDFAHIVSASPSAVLANLPYNISTQLLMHFIKIIKTNPEALSFMSLMFQKEVADRIVASPHNKDYGRLSVMVQHCCTVRRLMELPPQAFSPPPKVSSTVLLFQPKKNMRPDVDFDRLEKLVQQAFSQRRKMVRTTLKAYEAYFKDCHIDPTARAENLTLEQFENLVLILGH
jgi:16S rRNA (adenine1518-N6/adenine1519-N6)-dimethyltransferase